MNKKFLLLSVLSVLALAGCNCGPDNNPTTSVEAPTTSTVDPTTPGTSVTDPSTPTPANLVALEGIDLGIAGASKVASGTLVKNQGAEVTVTYAFGTDKYGEFIHIEEVGEYMTTEKVYGHDAAGNLYGIQDQGFGWQSAGGYNGLDPNSIKGPLFGIYVDLYGVTGILEYFKTVITANPNHDFVDLSTTTEYGFKLSEVVDTGWSTVLYATDVEFTIADEAVNSLSISVSQYSEDKFTADLENEGVYVLNPGAEPNSVELGTFTQVIGERVAVNEIDVENFYYSDFDLVDEDGAALADTIEMKVGVEFTICLANIAPSTASDSIDKITVKQVSGPEFGINGYIFNGEITLTANAEGEFVVEISSKNVTKTLNVTVTLPAPEEMTVWVYTEGDYGYDADGISPEGLTVYLGQTVYLAADMLPYSADQGYTANIDSNDYGTLTLNEEFYPNNWADPMIAYEFAATAIGTAELTFTSTADSTISETILVHVKDIPSLSSFVNKRYVYTESGNLVADVTLSNLEGNNGTVDIAYTSFDMDPTTWEMVGTTTTGTYNFAYDPTTTTFALTDADGASVTSYTLKFNASYELVLSVVVGEGDEAYSQSYPLSEYSPIALVDGITWRYVIDEKEGEDGLMVQMETIDFTFYADGTAEFMYMKRNQDDMYEWDADLYGEFTYTYAMNGDELVISLDDDAVAAITGNDFIDSVDSTMTFNADLNELTITISINGVSNTYTLTELSW